MRVLIILKYIPTFSSNFKSDLLHTIIKGHEEEGHSVLLLSTSWAAPSKWDVINDGFWLHQRALYWLLGKISTPLAFHYRQPHIIRSVIREHKSDPIDVILAVCTADYPGLCAYAINDVSGIPYVIQEHKNFERKYSFLDDIDKLYLKSLRDANALITVSPQAKDVMIKLGVRKDIAVIPNALSDEFYITPVVEKGMLCDEIRKWGDGGFIYGAWTNWRDIKRLDILLKAFLEVRCSDINAKLIIAGSIQSQSDEIWVKNFITENSLDNYILLFGVADREQIHQIAYAIDCCVISSDYETFGLPALEALAAGKPVVSTRCNGPEYIINSTKLGRVVEKGDSSILASAMKEIYNTRRTFDPELIRNSALQRFSRSSVRNQFTRIYREVINGKQ
ncbi:glycosyltransferase involved in cell wall biosynthesis [Methanocalculus alkaliphilus]|uniref:glycosyltransferase n=1 Tax=Methanocalculus alkaliphilus TaxID=768730 RepID=UPI0020A19EDC|nr:glycosyltransferase [Methanocalculus alkaliphilus]MCP1716126.1 glycosyltransferase involved in cell wall biosynthesis [Methanocalculus alkaliphilus]